MLFIFGWDHSIAKEYGPVEQRVCPNCHNEEFWQLNKISKWFTFFFIPIISYDNYYHLKCPICHNGIELEDAKMFKYLKDIAKVNSAFLEDKITDDERTIRLEKSYNQLSQYEELKRSNHIKDSKGFQNLVNSKTDDELAMVLRDEQSNYNPAFLLAVEEEIQKRKPN